MNKAELHESIIKNSQISFSRSGGKGGQNVNKVNTKVFLTLPISAIGGINENERMLIKTKLSPIINADNCLYLSVDDERFQEVNRKIAFERLENRIIQSLYIPKKRKPTKKSQAVKERILKLKRIRSEVKKNRKKIF